MSRSYRKPKAFICSGKNTEYYRERNRNTRTNNKRILNKLSNYRGEIGFDDLEELFEEEQKLEFIYNKKNKDFDTWNEPTDGSFMAKESDFKDEDIWKKDYYKKLQRK